MRDIGFALRHMFWSSRYEMEKMFEKKLCLFMLGLVRKVTGEKGIQGDSLHGEKKKMGFKVYELVCKKFLEGEDNEYTFCHLFLVLEWNLMARSENVADCHAKNIA
ncbi:hypothetical protein ACHAXS_000402, partial [Conticribra weissflogii]